MHTADQSEVPFCIFDNGLAVPLHSLEKPDVRSRVLWNIANIILYLLR